MNKLNPVNNQMVPVWLFVLYKIYQDYFDMIVVLIINILNQHKLQMVSLMIFVHVNILKCYFFTRHFYIAKIIIFTESFMFFKNAIRSK